MGTPLLQQISLMDNGVLYKLRKLPNYFPCYYLYSYIYLMTTFLGNKSSEISQPEVVIWPIQVSSRVL